MYVPARNVLFLTPKNKEIYQMITVYTTQTCAFCPMVKKFLTMRGVEFKSVDVTDDLELRQSLINRTGVMTVPIIIRDDDFVVGWQPARLARLIA